MHPFWIAIIVSCAHLVAVLGIIVFAAGPTSSRIEAGKALTRYDWAVLGSARAMTFPLLKLHRLYPGLLGAGGPPREHILMLLNSMIWGAAAGGAVAAFRQAFT